MLFGKTDIFFSGYFLLLLSHFKFTNKNKFIVYMKYAFSLLFILSTALFANTDNKPIDRYDFHLLTSKGEIILYYDDGTIKARIPLDKSIRSGKANTYYPDGSTKTERYYVDGEVDGTSKAWYKNGNLEGEETIRNGLRHGYKKSYYESGKKKEVVLYEDGNPVVIKMFREDGVVEFEKDYR
jgi:antitoxin component YwqK of YwqJK toxin-antitoxin module